MSTDSSDQEQPQQLPQDLEELLQSINAFRAQVIEIGTLNTQKPEALKALKSKLIHYGDILYEFITTFQMPEEAKKDKLLRSFLESVQNKMNPWSIEKSVFVPYWCDNVLKQDPTFIISPEHCRRLLKQSAQPLFTQHQ